MNIGKDIKNIYFSISANTKKAKDQFQNDLTVIMATLKQY